MATPDSLRVGLAFTTALPLTESQFESFAKSLEGKVIRGVGSKTTGEQVPILAAEFQGRAIVYDHASGVLSFDQWKLGGGTDSVEKALDRLWKSATLSEKDLKYAEGEAAFLFDARPSALKAIGNKLGPTPSAVAKILGGKVRPWGSRFVIDTAAEALVPFREVTPWLEATIEPFANNPKKVFVKLLIRRNTWAELRKDLESVSGKAESLFKEYST